jgi:Hypothetical protein (DUF2513)
MAQKRSMDLLRALLLKVEAEANPVGEFSLTSSDFDGFSEMQVWQHIQLLEDAGFIEEAQQMFGGESSWQVGQILWNGHEYLDKVRDPEVWRKTKEIAAKAGGGGVEVMSQIASSVISTAIAAALKIQGN